MIEGALGSKITKYTRKLTASELENFGKMGTDAGKILFDSKGELYWEPPDKGGND